MLLLPLHWRLCSQFPTGHSWCGSSELCQGRGETPVDFWFTTDMPFKVFWSLSAQNIRASKFLSVFTDTFKLLVFCHDPHGSWTWCLSKTQVYFSKSWGEAAAQLMARSNEALILMWDRGKGRKSITAPVHTSVGNLIYLSTLRWI